MRNSKVVKIGKEHITFNSGITLRSNHESDCCEWHWLDFEVLEIDDFHGMVFDLSNPDFFKRLDGYGIELLPINGHPVRVAGYGSNNGYYSSNLELVLEGKDVYEVYNITECQDIHE